MRPETKNLLEYLTIPRHSNDYWLLGGAIDIAINKLLEYRPIVINDICDGLIWEGHGTSRNAIDRRLRRAVERLIYGEDSTRERLSAVLGHEIRETVPLQEFLYAAVRWCENGEKGENV